MGRTQLLQGDRAEMRPDMRLGQLAIAFAGFAADIARDPIARPALDILADRLVRALYQYSSINLAEQFGQATLSIALAAAKCLVAGHPAARDGICADVKFEFPGMGAAATDMTAHL